MIIPQTRLLFWTAAAGLPVAIASALQPEVAWLLVVLVGAVLADAVRGQRQIQGVEATAEPITRLQKATQGSLFIKLSYTPAFAALRRPVSVAAALPEALGAGECLVETLLPVGATHARVAIACQPLERGSYPVSLLAVAVDSPLGFWSVRRRFPIETEVRVYPDLSRERAAAALFLAKARNGSQAFRRTGKGYDFEKVRDYQPGDAIQDIHWKASAKRRSPITKVYRAEQTQEVVVVLDASRLSTQRGPDGETLLERFVNAALVLALAARQQGDRFGIVAFSDKVHRFLPPRSGQAHYQACRDLLFDLEPTLVAPDFQEAATTLRLRLPKRALVIYLTTLGDAATAEAFHHSLPLLSRKHLLLVNMVQQPEVAPLFTRPAASVEQVYRHLGGHLLWRQLHELQKTLQREGVTLSFLEYDQLAARLVSQYMDRKARQLV